jgi:hypothetical protein
MSPIFDATSAQTGRLSVPPKRLRKALLGKALLRMALDMVRSERPFCE